MDAHVSDEIEKFFSRYRTRTYSKGQVLLLEGDNADYVYRLISGQVKQYDITYKGDEMILNVFKPPAFFPMSLAINKTPNLYTLEAETDVELLQAPAHEVVAFLKDHPEVTFDLLSRVYMGLDGVLGRMAHLMGSSAKRRLMYELSIAAKRYGETSEDGSSDLAMSEAALGARAGLTRETVSREMRKLEADGFVTLRAGHIRVNNLKALEEKLATIA